MPNAAEVGAALDLVDWLDDLVDVINGIGEHVTVVACLFVGEIKIY